MLNFDTPGPRWRGGDPSAWLGFSAAKRSVAFSMPDGFIGGRGGRPFRRRISSLSCWFSSLAAASAAFSFSLSSPSRSTSPINRRTSPTSSVAPSPSSESFELGDIPSLNHTFKLSTPPSAQEFAPVTKSPYNPLKGLDSDEKIQENPIAPNGEFRNATATIQENPNQPRERPVRRLRWRLNLNAKRPRRLA